jgi:hypothetical protein
MEEKGRQMKRKGREQAAPSTKETHAKAPPPYDIFKLWKTFADYL